VFDLGHQFCFSLCLRLLREDDEIVGTEARIMSLKFEFRDGPRAQTRGSPPSQHENCKCGLDARLESWAATTGRERIALFLS
jgi:hypothetical protein